MSRRELESLSIEELEAELARRRAEASPLMDLPSLEDEIDDEAERLKQTSLEARVAALAPETDEAKPCPKCGRATRVRVKNRERTLETRSGTLTLHRHYHYCNHCKGGFFPRDRELGLPAEGAVSFGLEARILDFGVNETFAQAAERWSMHYSKPISDNLVRRVVDRVGARCEASDERYLQHCLQPPAEEPSGYLVVQTDGSMVPIRGGDPWKEVKLGVVVRAENHSSKSGSQRGIVAKARYVGSLGPKREFAEALDRVLQVEHAKRTRQIVWVGDGAPWIWNLADELCPAAVQILDWYHAVEHALECGQTLLSGSSLLDDWERTCRRFLADGRVDALIEQLMECLEITSPDETKALNDLVRYYRNNAKRMQYNEYRNEGYPIGSGIVESAHGHVIQQRMKRTGQRWSLPRARRMVRLRTAYRTGECRRFHRSIRVAAEATRVAPIPQRQRPRASNR